MESNEKNEFNNLKSPTEHMNTETDPLSGKEHHEDSLFDSLMVEIGNDGKFQKRFNFLYNLLFIAMISMPYFNIFLSLSIPEHWCHVPGRELTNHSLEEWKAKWLPRTKSPSLKDFESCKMYTENNTAEIVGQNAVVNKKLVLPYHTKNINSKDWDSSCEEMFLLLSRTSTSILPDEAQVWINVCTKGPDPPVDYLKLTLSGNDKMIYTPAVSNCQYGWDFDRQWYTETIVTEKSWVCDREMFVTNTFATSRVGETIGTFAFGQLGDAIGRKPVFYISVFSLVLGRLLFTFTVNSYYVFLFSVVLGSMACTTTFQSPLVISMEVSDDKKRSQIAFLQCFGWVMGLCLLSFLAWVVRDWKLIMLTTTLPSVFVFFCYKLLPESPRWLASKGRVNEAENVLKYIAKVNNSKIPKNTYSVLEKIGNKKEKVYGLATLFANWRLAKNTIIIITNWTVSSFMYYVITLSVTSMSGNPFLNFFWQSIVELPGYILGKVLSDKIGRRWTQSVSFFLGALFCTVYLFLLTFKITYLEIYFLALVKLIMTITAYMVWLQAIEIYPTCVRQTGTSIGVVFANILGVLSPYVVYLGTSVDMRIPYSIALVLMIVAGIISSFLPETLNEKLPETLEDAKNFGINQKYWSFSKNKVSI